MRALVTFLMVTAAAALVSCQQYQQQGADNYVDEYAAYDQSPRPAHPTPRSYPTGSAQRQAAAPAAPKPTPVAILKQINKHNEDGSYTYGFEGADGSFKIETKLPTGEVKGKYGFVDDGGKVRVVEYGANKYGFQPAGEGITVAPPTLVDETTSKEALQAQNYQDYQDYQQPARPAPSRPVPRPAPAAPRQQHAYQQPQYQQPAPQQPQYQPAPQQSHTQAIYAPQQQAPSHARAPQTPIFSPAQPYQVPGSSYAAAPRAAAPQHVQPVYEEPSPPSQAFNHGPVQFSPAPAQAQRPQARSQQGGGILDQLARDYALPQGGAAPLHDISFGYY